MKRPLADKRPVGPFVQSSDDISKFGIVEVRLTPGEDTKYSVHGLLDGGKTTGVVVDADAIMVTSNASSDDALSFSLFTEDGQQSAEFSGPAYSSIGIKEKRREVVNIVLYP